MTAKEEFYALISSSFTENEVAQTKVIVDGLMKQISEKATGDEETRNRNLKACYFDFFWGCFINKEGLQPNS